MTARRQSRTQPRPSISWLIWFTCVLGIACVALAFFVNIGKGVLTLLPGDYARAEKNAALSAALKKNRQPPTRVWKA